MTNCDVSVFPCCPYCNCDIEYVKQTDHDYDDIYFFVYWTGLCPQCQRTFSFTETYRLVERSELK